MHAGLTKSLASTLRWLPAERSPHPLILALSPAASPSHTCRIPCGS